MMTTVGFVFKTESNDDDDDCRLRFQIESDDDDDDDDTELIKSRQTHLLDGEGELICVYVSNKRSRINIRFNQVFNNQHVGKLVYRII